MKRQLYVAAFFALAASVMLAQEASTSSPYQGVSSPPPDDTITADMPQEATPPAKPAAGTPMQAPAAAPVQAQNMMPAQNNLVTGTDAGIVQVAPQTMPAPGQPTLATRGVPYDPDGDIVHVAPLGPGELREGTMIRVRLMNDLSSSLSQKGEEFRSRVATDVVEGGEVVIPAGAEISGHVADVSTGRFGGHGSLLLKPEMVTLPNGETYRLRAMVASAPATHTKVDAEGVIGPDSRKKRDGIEYGGGVGAGVIAGAYLGGPAGALAGGLVGAALVTTHLLVSHPQASLEQGDVLMLTLTEQVRLVPAQARGE